MGETIVLPKSGLEIPWRDYHGRKAALRACGYDFAQIRETASPGLWQCQWADTIRTGTREECIDWLDAQALETRAALTPPGHVLVGPDARETVARELWEFNRVCEWTEAAEDEKTDYLLGADAVLRAIGVRGGA